MSCLNFHDINATFPLFFLIDTHWHCCAFFLPFLHLFFLPVAWPIDLAVQGCKYHCGFFHSCFPLFVFFSLSHYVHVHSHGEIIIRLWVAGSFCCVKEFTPRSPCRHTSLLCAAQCGTLVVGLALPKSDIVSRPSARHHQHTGCWRVKHRQLDLWFWVFFCVCRVLRVTRDPATTLPLRVSQRKWLSINFFFTTFIST